MGYIVDVVIKLPVVLSKANRLTNRQDFRAVFREGIRRQGSHLTLRALSSKENAHNVQEQGWVTSIKSNPQFTPTRIGISISTKVSKRATIRNRIKRQIRAAFRWLLPELLPGWRLVVVVQPLAAAEECDYNQFLQELKQLLAEAEVLNGHS